MIDKEERLNKLRKEIEVKGFIGLNKTKLAKKFNISRTTIYKDIEQIANEIEPEDINIQKLIVRSSVEYSLKETYKIALKSDDLKIKLVALDLLTKIADRYYTILDSLKEKQKEKEPLVDVINLT